MNKKEIISNIIWFGGLLIVLFIIRTFVFMPVVVSGNSMDPTLQNRERVIATKTKKIERFDIVTFPAPDDPKKSYVKRVIGLPGDTVEYKNDQLIINGEEYDEPYLKEFKGELAEGDFLTYVTGEDGQPHSEFSLGNLTALGSSTVPEGELFVLGDNRQISKDSRLIGFIEKADITGNVKFCIWPPSKFGPVNK